MEIGLDARLPTYSGGLGVLAGDTIRSAADLKMPGWREDNFSLRYALSIPKIEVWQSHVQAKV